MWKFSALNLAILISMTGCGTNNGTGVSVRSNGSTNLGSSTPPTGEPTPRPTSPYPTASQQLPSVGAQLKYADALRAIALAPNGWRGECAASARRTITATLKRLTIEERTYGNANCTGSETKMATRLSYSLADLPATYAATLSGTLVLEQVQYRLVTNAEVSAATSASETIAELPVKGLCGLPFWRTSEWRDVSQTACWNFADDSGLGEGKVTSVTPIVHAAQVSAQSVSWSATQDTLTFDGAEYEKF